MSNQQFAETTPSVAGQTFVAADTTAVKTLYQPQSAIGGRVDSILCTNSDVIDHYVAVYLNTPSATTRIGSVKVPAGAGFGAVPSVDLVSGLPVTNVLGLLIRATGLVALSMEVAVTAAFVVTAVPPNRNF